MTEPYANIRQALAMGPTPGPWRADGFEVMAARGQFYGGLILGADDVVVAQMVSAANAPLIADCDPDTIRDLLAERDQLAAENARLREALREARDAIEDLAGYASGYFREKHDLAGDLAKIDDLLREQEAGRE